MDYQAFIRSPNALMLLCLMLHETSEGKRPFTMSQAQMAKALGLTRQQTREALKKLLNFGLIQPTPQPTLQPSNNQAATYLTCCKITSCNTPQTKQQPSSNQPNNQPNNQAREQFETLWEAYRRKGSKKVALQRWLKLTDGERSRALAHAPAYRATRVTRYCKALEAYLNQRAWEGAITTDYGVELDPARCVILTDERLYRFYDYYNGKITGTLLSPVGSNTEERQVLMNIVLSYFRWADIEDAIDKAVRDPYNCGALPLTAGRHIQTFEEIMRPCNIIKANE